jgi:hypothetical protein
MRANMLAGELGERAQTIGHYFAQHLYVYDGDLQAQDEVQAKAEELAAANTRDGKTLQQLLEGTPSEDEMRTFAATRAEELARTAERLQELVGRFQLA